jgi:hypothetical protein
LARVSGMVVESHCCRGFGNGARHGPAEPGPAGPCRMVRRCAAPNLDLYVQLAWSSAGWSTLFNQEVWKRM